MACNLDVDFSAYSHKSFHTFYNSTYRKSLGVLGTLLWYMDIPHVHHGFFLSVLKIWNNTRCPLIGQGLQNTSS